MGHLARMQTMTSWRPLVRRIPSKQWRKKLCKHGSCFGSVNVVMHTEQDTSSWRLSSKVFISMFKGRKTKWVSRWKQQPPAMEPCDIKIPYLSDCWYWPITRDYTCCRTSRNCFYWSPRFLRILIAKVWRIAKLLCKSLSVSLFVKR